MGSLFAQIKRAELGLCNRVGTHVRVQICRRLVVLATMVHQITVVISKLKHTADAQECEANITDYHVEMVARLFIVINAAHLNPRGTNMSSTVTVSVSDSRRNRITSSPIGASVSFSRAPKHKT